MLGEASLLPWFDLMAVVLAWPAWAQKAAKDTGP